MFGFGNTLRFAVGDKNDLHSSVWRLWSNGDDLYLASRSFAHISKFSLHESGDFRYAINSDKKNPQLADRVLYKWRRPKEHVSGWTGCLGILVPPRMSESPIPPSAIPDTKKDIVYIKPAPQSKKVLINIFLTKKDADSSILLREKRERYEIVGSVDLKTERAWVVAFLETLTELERKLLREYFSNLKFHVTEKSGGNPIKLASLHVFEENQVLPVPVLIDIEVGKENIQSK